MPKSVKTAKPGGADAAGVHAPDDASLLDIVQLNALVEISDSGGSRLILELVTTFEAQSRQTLDSLTVAARTKNVPECRNLLHLLAGGAANLGLKRLHLLCRQADQALREDKDTLRACFPEELFQIFQESLDACRLWAKNCE